MQVYVFSLIWPIAFMLTILGICYGVSKKRNSIHWYDIAKSMFVAIIAALVITKIPPVEWAFEHLGNAINALKDATFSGTKFVFGYLGGAETPFDIPTDKKGLTHIFAFQSLPMVIVVSVISMLLFYWGIIGLLIRFFSPLFKRSLNVGGALGIVSFAKIFFGPMETALFVKPYLRQFSRSETLILITMGLSTSAMSVMPIYASIVKPLLPGSPMPIFLITNVVAIPITIALCKLVEPDTHHTNGSMESMYNFSGSLDAISRGTREGLAIFVNILAMLIVMAALISLCNQVLGLIPTTENITLQSILGYVFWPVALLMGIPANECFIAGKLLGTKIVLNEVFAFMDMLTIGAGLTLKTKVILTSCLASFANFGSVGVAVAGIAAMCPEQRHLLVEFGFKALFLSILATCLASSILGVLLV